MSYYIHTPLIALFINLLLVFLVLRRHRRSFQHQVFSLFLLGMGFWGFAIFAMRSSPDPESALQWDKVIVGIGPLTTALFYHFTLLFTHTNLRKWLIYGVYSLCALFFVLAPTDLVFSGMQEAAYGYAPNWGILSFLFMLTIYGFLLLGLSNLIRFRKTSRSPDERNRAALIIAGMVCTLLGGVADFIHSLGLPVPPLGIVGNILFASLATVAILKYRLLDIHIAIRKGLAYTLLSGLLAGIYVLTVFLVSSILQWQKIGLALIVVVTLAIAIALQPMLRWVQRVVDRWFYRERYNQLRALEEFSRQDHDVTNLDQLSSSLVSLIRLALRSSSVCLLMPHGGEGDFSLTASTSLAVSLPQASLKRNCPVIRWLRTQNGFLSHKDMEIIPTLQALSAKDRDTLNLLGAELLVALKTKDDLAGILLLSPKLSGEAYSEDDKRVLTVVSRQVSTALDNARLYNQAQEALHELRKTQDQLLRTERLRAIGEVAAGVGHDLRNLLTVTLGRAQLALERVQDNEKLKHDLQLIEQAALDGAQVVNRLQSFTKVGKERSFDLIDMDQLLIDALQMVQPRLSQQREIEGITTDVIVDLGEGGSVRGKKSELREMLTNILINAIEAMPRGGKLTVRSRQQDDHAVISIEDTGVGMDREVSKRIFESFYTTKGPQGVGLGLSIAYGVAKKHGGDISVSSKLGKGSSFTIKLPATKQQRVAKAVSSKARSGTKKGAALVIDDDKAVAEVLSEILASDGYSVDLASDGKEGLALAQRKDCALVITDLGMPGMSGRDIAKAVNTTKPAIPIFLITGWDVKLQPVELMEWGITSVITKPFTKAGVLAQIERTQKSR